ncbi:MAG TPA: hypothetical protein P5050_01820 [Bacteroidia bacterium]|nr:hypothetical protein [Bacteroidia bacterium]HRS57940.1 hypothetical protein [Bacteroidia bacterium]HRU67983.1 hypothetical protein [Bacteroidia bacterium]
MLRHTFFLILLTLSSVLKAQEVRFVSVKVNQYGQLSECRFKVSGISDTLYLIVNESGKLTGIEGNYSYNTMNINYFDRYANDEEKGKISQINNNDFTYYSYLEPKEKEGEIAGIGKIKLDYYTADPDKAGKIRMIGQLVLNYYTRQNDPALSGKISKAGDVFFDYFSSVSDLELKGKVLKIGDYSFEYYSQYDDPLKAGRIKSVKGEDKRFELILVF